MIKFWHIFIWFITSCIIWVIYSYCNIYKLGYCNFIINLILSPIGISLCLYAISNKNNFYKCKQYVYMFFMFYGGYFLIYDIYLIINEIMSYKDFGLISDVSIIYFARCLKFRYKKTK